MGSRLWSRRDRTQLVKDIMLILAEGSVSKTRLQNLAGLNKRLFETYVEKVLVRYGLVERRRVGRTTYYMLTRKGRVYLNALVIGDIEVLAAEEEFAERVAEALTGRGLEYRRGVFVGDEELSLPVDFAFNTGRGSLYLYLAATRVAALTKHCMAAAARRLTGGAAVVLAEPETPEGGDGRGSVPVVHYHPGSAEHAAERIAGVVAAFSSGRLEAVAAARRRGRMLVL